MYIPSLKSGKVVKIKSHKSEKGKGLSYPSFIGRLQEDCNGEGWDVVEVSDILKHTIRYVYSFDVQPLNKGE